MKYVIYGIKYNGTKEFLNVNNINVNIQEY